MSLAGSSYAAGAATMGGGYPGNTGNAGVDVKMPSSIRDEIVTVATQMQALGKLIDAAAAAGKVPPDFLTGWSAFKTEWQNFSNTHRSWVSRTWYAAYEKTVEYRKRLEVWRLEFEKVTGTKVGYPSPGATPEGLSPDGSGFPWKTLMWGGLIIGGLYGVSKLFSETRQLKHDIVGERPLIAPRGHVHNPPSWVQDPDVWESARLAVEPYSDSYDNPHAVVTHVYKQMGGRQAAA